MYPDSAFVAREERSLDMAYLIIKDFNHGYNSVGSNHVMDMFIDVEAYYPIPANSYEINFNIQDEAAELNDLGDRLVARFALAELKDGSLVLMECQYI